MKVETDRRMNEKQQSGPSQQEKKLAQSAQLLAAINQLTIKAFKAKNAQTLFFIILNDTVPIVFYNRATLWKIEKTGKMVLLGISGQVQVSKTTDLSKQWQVIANEIKEPNKIQELVHNELPKETSAIWLPIFAHEKAALGLWLERWDNASWKEEEIEILKFLLLGYGAAYEKFYKKFSLKRILSNKPLGYVIGIALVSSLFLPVPLRVVAPCEIVPKNPTVIAAPLEGIIKAIVVRPGQEVNKGELLFEYDKRVPLQDLKVAAKKVEIVKAEVDKATAEAEKDKKSLAELGVAALKLRKEKLELALAEFKASQLDVYAPITGVAVLDAPEEWDGKPVKMGEKVLLIANPKETRVRMWIPEDDNIALNPEEKVKVVLNVMPEKTFQAKMIYIASYTHMTEKGVSSFIAEADWIQEEPEAKLGLKGSAILYGEKVSLFYWIIRKPWNYIRRFTGF